MQKNNYNSKAIIFIENGSEDQLVSKDNKNRFFLKYQFCDMNFVTTSVDAIDFANRFKSK